MAARPSWVERDRQAHRTCVLYRVGGWAIKPDSNVLRRKLRSEQVGAEQKAVSPVKAARISLARAADQAFKLALRVGAIRQSRLDLSEVVEQIHDDWALFPLLHDDGSVGVICIDPPSNIAFVEQQTLGRVAKKEAAVRKLTRTDKALSMAFLDRFMRLFDDALVDAPTAYWTRGYRTQDAVETRHLMVLLLDASEYRGFEMTCEIVDVARTGAIRFFLPIKDPARENLPRACKMAKLEPDRASPKLRSAALAARVEMDAIMCKITMPLSQLSRLKLGQLVPLPQNAAQQARLQDKLGKTSLPVSLGQLHGMRAVRLAPNLPDQTQGEDGHGVIAAPPKDAAAASAPQHKPHPGEAVQTPAEPMNELDALLDADKA